MIETLGIFLRICLSGFCWHFPQPFQTLAKCNAQGVIEVAASGRGATAKCISVTYMAVTGTIGPQGPQGVAGPQGPVGPIGPQGPAGDGTTTGNYLTAQ